MHTSQYLKTSAIIDSTQRLNQDQIAVNYGHDHTQSLDKNAIISSLRLDETPDLIFCIIIKTTNWYNLFQTFSRRESMI